MDSQYSSYTNRTFNYLFKFVKNVHIEYLKEKKANLKSKPQKRTSNERNAYHVLKLFHTEARTADGTRYF